MVEFCHTRFSNRLTFLVAAFMFALAGCGTTADDGVARVEVSGTVSIDEKPVSSGSISFRPVGDGPSAGGAVTGGEFHISADRGPSPGTYRVTVSTLAAKRLDGPPSPPDPPIEHSQEVTISKTPEPLTLKFSSAP